MRLFGGTTHNFEEESVQELTVGWCTEVYVGVQWCRVVYGKCSAHLDVPSAYAAPHTTALYTTPHLHYTTLHYTLAPNVSPNFATLPYTALQHSTLPYAVLWSVGECRLV